MSQDKNKRQIEVFKILQRLKKAKPIDIAREISTVLGIDFKNQAFQRAIHRDLKSLQSAYIVGAHYYTAGGVEILPGEEDKHSNVRVEYYLLGSHLRENTHHRSLLSLGGDAIIHPHIDEDVCFETNYERIPLNSQVLSIVLKGQSYHVWFPQEARPLTIHIGRKSSQVSDVEYRKTVLKTLSPRSFVLLLPSRSISRFLQDKKYGHCYIQYHRNISHSEILDCNSTYGVKASSISSSQILEIFDINSTDETHLIDPFSQFRWAEVETSLCFESSFAIQLMDIHLISSNK